MTANNTLEDIQNHTITCTGCGGVTKATNVEIKDGVLVNFDMTTTCWCKDEEIREE